MHIARLFVSAGVLTAACAQTSSSSTNKAANPTPLTTGQTTVVNVSPKLIGSVVYISNGYTVVENAKSVAVFSGSEAQANAITETVSLGVVTVVNGKVVTLTEGETGTFSLDGTSRLKASVIYSTKDYNVAENSEWAVIIGPTYQVYGHIDGTVELEPITVISGQVTNAATLTSATDFVTSSASSTSATAAATATATASSATSTTSKAGAGRGPFATGAIVWGGLGIAAALNY